MTKYNTIKQNKNLNVPTAIIEKQYIEQHSEKINKILLQNYVVLENSPLNIIFGEESTNFAKIYNHNIKYSHKTDEMKLHLAPQLKNIKQTEESDQKINLLLSRNSRFIYAEEKSKTHNLQYIVLELKIKKDFLDTRLDRIDIELFCGIPL